MKNVVWLLLNTKKWAEPLPRSTEERNRLQQREEGDLR